MGATRSEHIIHLGYEVTSAAAVRIPLHHLVVTGITQLSGKTTTLEALIARSGLRAMAFITKRGESGFQEYTAIPPYFRQERGWQFYEAILEAAVRERLKFERGRIMRASKDAENLQAFHRNVQQMLKTARGINEEILTRLDEYCKIVVPQLEQLPLFAKLWLAPGINVMDLSRYTPEMQALVIYSSIVEVFERASQTVIIIPEANEFIPQHRGSPVKLAALRLARKGAAVGNYLWLDTQDLAGVAKEHLKQVGVYILGVQIEDNEVRRTLAHIPQMPKPKAHEIQGLDLGHFIVCYTGGRCARSTCSRPGWMNRRRARSRGERRVTAELASQKALSKIGAENEAFWRDRGDAGEQVAVALRKLLGETPGPDPADVIHGPATEERIVQRVLAALSAGGMDWSAVQVIPVDKLRKDFQIEEASRMLEIIKGLRPLQKKILKLLETTDGSFIGQTLVAQRLGRATLGGSLVDLGKATKEMASLGVVEVKERQGVRKALREKIAADLAFYGATAEEVERTYQTVLFEIANVSLDE